MHIDYNTDQATTKYSELVNKLQLETTFNNLINLFGTSLEGKKMIDLGCGDGTAASLFAAQGAVVTAVDGASDFINYAKQHYSNIQFHCADVCSLSSKSTLDNFDIVPLSFDLAVSSMVIPCMQTAEQVKDLFKAAALLLKSQGYFAYIKHHSDPIYTHDNLSFAGGSDKQFLYSIHTPQQQKYDGMPFAIKVYYGLTRQFLFEFNDVYWSNEFLAECYEENGFKKVKEIIYCDESKEINPSNNNTPFFEHVLLQKIRS